MDKGKDVEIEPFKIYLKGTVNRDEVIAYVSKKYKVEKLYSALNGEDFILVIG